MGDRRIAGASAEEKGQTGPDVRGLPRQLPESCRTEDSTEVELLPLSFPLEPGHAKGPPTPEGERGPIGYPGNLVFYMQ